MFWLTYYGNYALSFIFGSNAPRLTEYYNHFQISTGVFSTGLHYYFVGMVSIERNMDFTSIHCRMKRKHTRFMLNFQLISVNSKCSFWIWSILLEIHRRSYWNEIKFFYSLCTVIEKNPRNILPSYFLRNTAVTCIKIKVSKNVTMVSRGIEDKK